MPAPIQIKERLYGQKRYGTMIPKRQLQVDESHSLFATEEKVFIDAGLGNYYDDAYGWASFVNVTKVTYMIGYGMTKGRVYAKTNSNVAQLVGYSTLIMASAGWGIGATVSNEIIFFQDEDSFKTFSRGNFALGGRAKATVSNISADCTAGTAGIPLLDRAMGIVAKDDDKPKYHHGIATFFKSRNDDWRLCRRSEVHVYSHLDWHFCPHFCMMKYSVENDISDIVRNSLRTFVHSRMQRTSSEQSAHTSCSLYVDRSSPPC
mmetsp:Transcript_19678/g.35716  ORF Transcript_19678/g.35716 Transcript_19678/m.35716 type:complete len:262 (+) Transcript_19678:1204-1989(+)